MKRLFEFWILFSLLVAVIHESEAQRWLYWGQCCLQELLKRLDMERSERCYRTNAFDNQCDHLTECDMCYVYFRFPHIHNCERRMKIIDIRFKYSSREYRVRYNILPCPWCPPNFYGRSNMEIVGMCRMWEWEDQRNLKPSGCHDVNETSGRMPDDDNQSDDGSCEKDEECQENQVCAQNGNMTDYKVCLCKDNFVQIRENCYIANVSLGERCVDALQCSGTPGASLCSNELCDCDEDFELDGDICRLREPSTHNREVNPSSVEKGEKTNLVMVTVVAVLGFVLGGIVVGIAHICIIRKRKSTEGNHLGQGFSNAAYEADKRTEHVKIGIYSEVTEDLQIVSDSNDKIKTTASSTRLNPIAQQENIYNHLNETRDEHMYDHTSNVVFKSNVSINEYGKLANSSASSIQQGDLQTTSSNQHGDEEPSIVKDGQSSDAHPENEKNFTLQKK